MSVAENPSMKRYLRRSPLSAWLLGFAPAAHAQISFDVHMGTPPAPPRVYRVPPQPGPDYEWVEGYLDPVNGQYRWHNGYWTHPPYADAYWVAPDDQAARTIRVTGRADEAMSITTIAGIKLGSGTRVGATRKDVREARAAPTTGTSRRQRIIWVQWGYDPGPGAVDRAIRLP